MTGLSLAALSWGALAFGAVYPWAYWPLFAATAATGLVGLAEGRSARFGGVGRLATAIGAVVVSAALQLVPLPSAWLSAISSSTPAFLRDYDIGYRSGLVPAHAISIQPANTLLALAGLVALVVFMFGVARSASRRGATALADGIVVLGLLLAVVAIVQRATATERIYGLWSPYDHAFQIFGPFVNKNHFAGWMIMALSLAIGAFCARLSRAMGEVRPDWRSRTVWLSTPSANKLLLTAFAMAVMALALVMTLSRSGILSFGATLAMAGVFVVRRAQRKVLGVIALALLAIAALSWAGIDPVVHRFAAEWGVAGRFTAWAGAIDITRQFPLTGTGLNTYGTVMLFHEPRVGAHWSAAHNDYLQLAAEGGLLVGLPIAAALALLAATIRRRFRHVPEDLAAYWLRVGAVCGLVGVALQELVDFSLQIPGIAVLFAVLCAIAIHGRVEPRRRSG